MMSTGNKKKPGNIDDSDVDEECHDRARQQEKQAAANADISKLTQLLAPIKPVKPQSSEMDYLSDSEDDDSPSRKRKRGGVSGRGKIKGVYIYAFWHWQVCIFAFCSSFCSCSSKYNHSRCAIWRERCVISCILIEG